MSKYSFYEKTVPPHPGDLVSRIKAGPLPLIRHQYGESSLEHTIQGAKIIAESGCLDILSIGPDQNAREHLFHPKRMISGDAGHNGVPLRSADDLAAIYRGTRCGNYPLILCHCGRRDLMRWAQMCADALRSAWGAVPLCWTSVVDRRSLKPTPHNIVENQRAMALYAMCGIPVEVNESHHWSARRAHDALVTAMAFLGAYNAKVQGVRHYVIQLMHDPSAAADPGMDLARMLAALELVRTLEGEDFTAYRELRIGPRRSGSEDQRIHNDLMSWERAAAVLRPDILYVAGRRGRNGSLEAADVVRHCRTARRLLGRMDHERALRHCDLPRILKRKARLAAEARVLLGALMDLGGHAYSDPWSNAAVLSRAMQLGLLDAPDCGENEHLRGEIITANNGGAWDAVDAVTRRPISEVERIERLGLKDARISAEEQRFSAHQALPF